MVHAYPRTMSSSALSWAIAFYICNVCNGALAARRNDTVDCERLDATFMIVGDTFWYREAGHSSLRNNIAVTSGPYAGSFQPSNVWCLWFGRHPRWLRIRVVTSRPICKPSQRTTMVPRVASRTDVLARWYTRSDSRVLTEHCHELVRIGFFCGYETFIFV